MSGDEDGTFVFMDEYHFEYGDIVKHRLHAEVKGIVIGDADFGRTYVVRLAGTLATASFHGIELLLVQAIGSDPDAEEKDVKSEDQENFTETNVIPFPDRKVAGSA